MGTHSRFRCSFIVVRIPLFIYIVESSGGRFYGKSICLSDVCVCLKPVLSGCCFIVKFAYLFTLHNSTQ
jgi:hypothetical protein